METQLTPIELAKQVFINFYIHRDIENVLRHFTKTISWIGPCDQEYFTSYEEIEQYFKAGNDAVPTCHLFFQDMRVLKEDEHSALVMGRFLVSTDAKEGMLLEVKQRASFYICLLYTSIHQRMLLRL